MTHKRFVLHVLASLGLVLIALSPTMMAVPTSVQAQDSPSITVVKDLVPDTDPGRFNLQIDGTTYFTDASDGDTTGAVAVSIGTHTVTETAGTGTNLANYVTTIGGDCDASGNVTLALGENKTCTITNTKLGSITIVKETDPAGGTGFDFTGDLGGFTLNDDGSRSFGNLISGDYTVTETVPAGWDLTGVVCTGGDSTPTTDGVTIHLEPSENITCTFNNEELICPVGMISYWKLDETSGTTFDDCYNGNHAECPVGNCPIPVAGQINGGQAFDGSNDEINVPPDASFDWGKDDSFSIEFWMKRPGTPAGNEVIVGRQGPTHPKPHIWVGVGQWVGNVAAFCAYDTSGTGTCAIGYTIVTGGTWHHIVAVRDASSNQIRIYVDGIEEGSVDQTYSAGFDSTTALNIGWLNLSGGFHFNGTVDEVALYNRTLSPIEIQQHYLNGLAGLEYCASIAITKDADQTVVNGSNVTFTISVTNTGVLDLAHVIVTDAPVPDCDADLGGLDAGHNASYTCTVFNVMDSFTNSATVTGTTFAGVEVTDTASVDLPPPEVIQYLPIILKNFKQ